MPGVIGSHRESSGAGWGREGSYRECFGGWQEAEGPEWHECTRFTGGVKIRRGGAGRRESDRMKPRNKRKTRKGAFSIRRDQLPATRGTAPITNRRYTCRRVSRGVLRVAWGADRGLQKNLGAI